MAEDCEDCLDRCCRCKCLLSVPGASLAAWTVLVAAVGACGASLMVAVARSRDLLDWTSLFEHANAIIIAVMAGMIALATTFLILSTVSSRPLSSYVFCSAKKNRCARFSNAFIAGTMLFLLAAWVLVCVVISVPIVLLAILHIMYKERGAECINLQYYGFLQPAGDICGEPLLHFYNGSREVLVCYIIALVSAIMVVVGLTTFTICTSANVVTLRESRFATYRINERNGYPRKNEFVDTRM